MNEPTMSWPRGLRIDVLRHVAYGDTTNGGVSSNHSHLTLTGTVDVAGNFEPLQRTSQAFEADLAAPEVWLLRRSLNQGRVWAIVPSTGPTMARSKENIRRHLSGLMAGGNYATGDSRLSALLGFYGAVSIHDRREA